MCLISSHSSFSLACTFLNVRVEFSRCYDGELIGVIQLAFDISRVTHDKLQYNLTMDLNRTLSH